MLSSGSPISLAGSSTNNSMQQSAMAYGERPQLGLDIEFGADPASGAFFQSDGRKHDDLKQMLDSNKDGLKLEAMKRIIGMIARGRDASELFPAVVKNVVSKNIEVKKLVYVYLVRYAEEQQDLALLSISTFQRALKDPNQLIRASALRVLSSIRVNMIVPIVMLAIRDSASDMSPYVRKTAAHAIPKLYSLDNEQKEELVTVIEKLLSDRTTLVVGSAVMAFDEVCPERVDLIHKNYRKLCNLLVDVDEWGQIIIINMLTRYARTQFVDPNADEPVEDESSHSGGGGEGGGSGVAGDGASTAAAVDTQQKFYDDETTTSESDDVETENQKHKKSKSKKKSKKSNKNPIITTKSKDYTFSTSSASYHVDLDHRLLLRQTKPLLQSRNASVVMAVAQLYHHVAPRNEVQLIAKALIRLLRSHKEVQSVVLTCIASMSTRRKSIFEPHVKSFFVRTSDPTHIKLLKLEILTNLATVSSISLILREFQTYISSSDRSFVAATIQAIGRCAAAIKEVTETCLNGLVHLLSNRDENVVAESVVVIKKLLQAKSAEHFDIIVQMAKLLDFITVPAARASIIWLIGEYNEKVPKIAPDVLRKMAKTFVDEEDAVKLQILNLGVKLYLTNPEQTSLLCQYVFTLARYDANYDVRDRARFLKQFIFPASGNSTILSENARKVFLSPKPAPQLESKYRDRDHFQLGSLSHYLNMRATGYTDLPKFPSVAPDPTVRNIEGFMHETMAIKTSAGNNIPGFVNATANTKQTHKTANLSKISATDDSKNRNEKSFFTDDEDKSAAGSNDDSDDSDDSESSSNSSSNTSSTESSSETAKKDTDEQKKQQQQQQQQQQQKSSKQKDKDVQIIEEIKKKKKAAVEPLITTIDDATDSKNVSGTSDSESSSSASASASDSSDSDSESDNSENDGSSSSESENSNNDDDAKEIAKTKSKAKAKVKTTEETANVKKNKKAHINATAAAATVTAPAKGNLDLLLDLDDIPPIGPVMTPSLGGFLTPGTPMLSSGGIGAVGLLPQNVAHQIELVGPSHIDYKHKELLNKLSGHGIQLSYRFTRSPHLYSSAMVSIELLFKNQTVDEITNIQMGQKNLPNGMNLNEFAPIMRLQPQQSVTSILGVDFNDSTHAIEFDVETNVGKSRVTLKPPIGELIRSVKISESFFKQERTKLRGLNEHQTQLMLPLHKNLIDENEIKQKIYECINVANVVTTTKTTTTTTTKTKDDTQNNDNVDGNGDGNGEGVGDVGDVGSERIFCFSGQTMNSKILVLITLILNGNDNEKDGQQKQQQKLSLMVNCEKMVIGSMVLNELRNALSAILQ